MHLVIVALFLLLLACVLGWLSIYRGIGQASPPNHPRYRLYQALLALIATLTIVLALLIVFSSNPGGDADDYLWWP